MADNTDEAVPLHLKRHISATRIEFIGPQAYISGVGQPTMAIHGL